MNWLFADGTTPDTQPDPDAEWLSIGKGIKEALDGLNERLDKWGDRENPATNTATSSATTPDNQTPADPTTLQTPAATDQPAAAVDPEPEPQPTPDPPKSRRTPWGRRSNR